MRRFLKENGLTLVLFLLFVLFWGGQSVAGWLHANEERAEHGQPPESWSAYVVSGDFFEATAESWESEFLQMAAFVWLTVFLRQKGSPESKKVDGQEPVDRHPWRMPRLRGRCGAAGG